MKCPRCEHILLPVIYYPIDDKILGLFCGHCGYKDIHFRGRVEFIPYKN